MILVSPWLKRCHQQNRLITGRVQHTESRGFWTDPILCHTVISALLVGHFKGKRTNKKKLQKHVRVQQIGKKQVF